MTRAELVLDASVAVRGLLDEEGPAPEILGRIAAGERVAHAPDLIVSEVTSALRLRVDPDRWPVAAADERLGVFLALPVELHPGGPLACSALGLAVNRGLSAYDAMYAVLAEELEVTLVTADRRLAGAVPGAELIR